MSKYLFSLFKSKSRPGAGLAPDPGVPEARRSGGMYSHFRMVSSNYRSYLNQFNYVK
jgi:hypothetical protein